MSKFKTNIADKFGSRFFFFNLTNINMFKTNLKFMYFYQIKNKTVRT
jgi:hypothetical protein